MRYDKELAWLLDEDWHPKSVTLHSNRNSEHNRFDEMEAKSYGYDSVKHMNKHNHAKDKAHELKYGDQVKGLI